MVSAITGQQDNRRMRATEPGNNMSSWSLFYHGTAPATAEGWSDMWIGACPVARFVRCTDGRIYIQRYGIDDTTGYSTLQEAVDVVCGFLGYAPESIA